MLTIRQTANHEEVYENQESRLLGEVGRSKRPGREVGAKMPYDVLGPPLLPHENWVGSTRENITRWGISENNSSDGIERFIDPGEERASILQIAGSRDEGKWARSPGSSEGITQSGQTVQVVEPCVVTVPEEPRWMEEGLGSKVVEEREKRLGKNRGQFK